MCTTRVLECGRPATELEIRLAPDPASPGEARAFVRYHVPRLGFPALVDTATLVATELITNSVKYAPEGPCWLTLRLPGGRLLIEVQDCSPELPVYREPDYVAESGRGLHVVNALCSIFEWLPACCGKVIFAQPKTNDS